MSSSVIDNARAPQVDGVRSTPGGAASASAKTLHVLTAALTHTRFTDIVAATGLAKATVHRILATLVNEGYVAGSAKAGYHAGPALMLLAGRALTSVDISEVALPAVRRVVAQTSCTVHVGAATDTEMVYVIRQDGTRPYRMRSRVGLGIPMHCSGMGKAVLADWSPDRVDALIQRVGLPRRTDSTITTRERLHDELARVRERGYALDLGENEVGTVCVSAGIRNHTGRVTHGLSISSIALEHPARSIEAFAPVALAAAAEISAALGAPSPAAPLAATP